MRRSNRWRVERRGKRKLNNGRIEKEERKRTERTEEAETEESTCGRSGVWGKSKRKSRGSGRQSRRGRKCYVVLGMEYAVRSMNTMEGT